MFLADDNMVEHRFDPKAPGIVLFVSVCGEDNKRRVKMVLDTGSTFVLISWKIAQELGYKPAVSKEWTRITTATAVIYAPVITLKAVATLGIVINDVKVVCHNLPDTSRVDGLLGLSYLRNFKVEIDFKKGILTLV